MTTVRELLFGDPGAGTEAAGKLAHDVSISQAVIAKAAETLGFELGEVLLSAWRTRSALLTAAKETNAAPGLVRVVTLRGFAVPWDYEMHLDIMVNGTRATTITLTLTLELEVAELEVVIQSGQLKKIERGRYRVAALLSLENVPLIERSREFDLRHEINVGDGIALITG